jgi:hypothetical protein
VAPLARVRYRRRSSGTFFPCDPAIGTALSLRFRRRRRDRQEKRRFYLALQPEKGRNPFNSPPGLPEGLRPSRAPRFRAHFASGLITHPMGLFRSTGLRINGKSVGRKGCRSSVAWKCRVAAVRTSSGSLNPKSPVP